MEPTVQEDVAWDPLDTAAPRSASHDRDRRHSSSASTSTFSTGSSDSSGARGRRSRPSVVSASSQLPTLREKGEQRNLSFDSPPSLLASTLTPSDSEETVVSSKKALTNFNKVAARNTEKDQARRELLNRYNEENNGQRAVYRRLKSWVDAEYQGLIGQMLSWVIPSRRQPSLPHIEELKALAKHYYPPRSELKCHVCDFGDGRAEHQMIDLGQLENCWQMKPDWADVRWIHAPLGLGLTHSSVEDIFLHDGPTGRLFEEAGRAGWPYLETEILNFRHRDNFQEMRDIYILLNQNEELLEDLNASTFRADQNASLQSDINWRAEHLAMNPTFWELVPADMPWQLSEGLSIGMHGPRDGLRPLTRHVENQTLSFHPFYKDAQLVRNPFRTFHRGDGFLLTLSPMAGVNYLDKNFSRHLSEPIDAMFDNDDASAVGHAFQAFAGQGTTTWHRKTVEWFLVYLLTEVGVTPHPVRQGFNAPSFESAYSAVIQDLKRRRYEKWRPKKTQELVRDYLTCIDEITTIRSIQERKVELFKIMQADLKRFESEDAQQRRAPDNPDGETSAERLVWAINMVQKQHQDFERLLIDLKQSMDALFQLRSIEQNELAIVSDSQNKAIMVFTVVTVIFLPLSFFTSYYGMNLKDVVNTAKTQHYFWKVCGTATFAIVLFTAFCAFRHSLRRTIRSKMMKGPGLMV